MIETNPSTWSLVALLLAAVALPPLVAATLLRGEPETKATAPAPAHHAAFCAEAAPAPVTAPTPVAVAVTEPVLACGSVGSVTP